jgi:two-component sensor histidine kinase
LSNENPPSQVEALLAAPELAGALESEQFKRFLDQVPIAIAVSELNTVEVIVYANPDFETLSGIEARQLQGTNWDALTGVGVGKERERSLSQALIEDMDCVGTFRMERPGRPEAIVDAYSNLIVNEDGEPCFRLVALVDVTVHSETDREALEKRIQESDVQLRELQHRVKNNLQMITALIRLEMRNVAGPDKDTFERLAGRVESLALLYKALSSDENNDEIDLGTYVSQISAAVMASHAVEGIRLNMKLDTYPVSINVAMPTGLVINELLTNALKHAFVGKEGGTITVQCTVDGDGCRVTVADDGVGLAPGDTWPKPGKMSSMIVQSLKENAKADFIVETSPQNGTKLTILFKRDAAVVG